MPVRMTEGYNRRPRVVFPHALEVGISSEDEVVEIELSSWVPPSEFAKRISEALPEGLPVKEVQLAPPRRQSSVAVEAHYRAELDSRDAESAEDGVAEFVAAASWPIERRQHNGNVRQIDLRRHVVSLEANGDTMELRLRLGMPGAAKPREVLAAVLGRSPSEALDITLVKTRTLLASPA